MKKIVGLVIFLLVVSISYAQPIFDFTGTITKITDGDTVYVSTGGTAFKVRILGIDTPEKYIFGGIKDYKYYGCGVSASHFAEKKLIKGKKYGFYKDSLAKSVGKYGRKLRFIKILSGDIDANKAYGYSILKQGLANFYKWENQSFSGVYKQIDNENKLAWKGMYNPFCKAQDKFVKENGYRSGTGEIQNIIDKTLLSKNNFHYQLQNTNFDELKTLSGNIIVVDPDDSKLTGGQLGKLKEKGNIVLAYLSIGEAEPYRSYWKSDWVDENGNLTDKAPDWLGAKNANWGSYYVRYRLTGWQDIVFDQIDKIKDIGYDGVVLDTLDAYGYWLWEGVTGADQKMVDFVGKIREHLGDYLAIIPNGGLPLIEKTGYLDLINGQLTESLFSLNNKERTQEDKNRQLQYLNKVKNAGKVVMDIDYISGNNDLVCKYYDFIKGKGFLGAVYNKGLGSFGKIKCEVKKTKISSSEIPSGKGLWVWKTSFDSRKNGKLFRKFLYDSGTQQDNLVKFVKEKGFKKVYLFIGTLHGNWDDLFSKHKLYNEQGLSNLLKRLNQQGVSVYALYYINDNPNNLDNYEKVVDLVESVDEYNTRYPNAKFVGLQLDQEVYYTGVYDNFLSMLKLIQQNTAKYHLINQVALKPLWTRQDYDGEKFVKKILDIVDEGVIMAYDDELKTIENIVNKTFYGDLDIGINLGKNTTNSGETLYDEIKQNGLNWFNTQIIDKLYNNYSGNNLFKGVSVHHYTSYFYLDKGVEPINYKFIPACTDSNWICSSSCGGTWQKVGNCSGGVQKSGVCGSSCSSGGGGGGYIPQVNHILHANNKKGILKNKGFQKIDKKKPKEIQRKSEEDLKKLKENKIKNAKELANKIQKALLDYIDKRGLKDKILIYQVEKLSKKIQDYKLGKISKNQLKLAIDNFVETLKKVEKRKIIANKIKSLQFKINTNHKYLKYENMFRKFFEERKQKILQNSKYWTEDYYNYLRSFVLYTEWLFVDIENNDYQNIKSYVDGFRKIVRKMKKVK